MHIQPLLAGALRKRPLVIAGPCSAEREEQVMATARALAAGGRTDIFRVGVWKPRTRPGRFEGAGEVALPWVARAAKETGIPAAIEIANPKHLELALKHQIHLFWLGARTVVNPFMVQELADALKGLEVAVMVKNPVNPDINLWMGALERLYKAGITRLAAVHRGFSHFESAPLRNKPFWEIPIALKRRVRNLPVITDPSHICGQRALLREVAQKAMDLEMDGVMIETHINPDEALTDARQQVTPEALHALLDSLTIRKVAMAESFEQQVQKWRGIIDEKDQELLNVLSSRLAAVAEIGKLKKDHHVTILQIDRWNQTVERYLEEAVKFGINPDFIKRMLWLLHEESIRLQEDIFREE
ncbi:MAG: 3-deoxy-7-phosphoheptulonate synthase [Bacteroidetes bacterium]|nr:MAG: 3-deoxy-7-phosphoheptulonate synthase [Bacteroidota bacterium]PIE88209.1 MAG: 3-deoxy-7-phosphoheptulonate synthase [Bacteroidota bacterium]